MYFCDKTDLPEVASDSALIDDVVLDFSDWPVVIQDKFKKEYEDGLYLKMKKNPCACVQCLNQQKNNCLSII